MTRVLKWVGNAAWTPTKGYDGDAGFDLYVSERTVIPYAGISDIPCGISIQLPPGVWGMLVGRSSTVRRKRLLVVQGIIDNGYRGEIFAATQNLGNDVAVVERGERIAQLLLFDLVSSWVSLERVAELDESERGDRAFGSTGT